MKITKKSKIAILILSSLISACVIVMLIIFNYNNIKILYYEENYNISSNSENLIKLCLSLRTSNRYDLIIRYYPKLLNDEEAFTTDEKYLKPYFDNDAGHDEVQLIYIFSYLYTGQDDTFKDKYIKYYPRFKALAYDTAYVSGVAYEKTTTIKQLNVILEAFQDNYSNLSNKPLDEIGNLNVQSYIYQRLGDSANQKTIEQEKQKIWDSLKKK